MRQIARLLSMEAPSSEVTALHPLIIGKGRVGIELELENIMVLPSNSRVDGWQVTRDGSLRNNGVEYILRGAQGGSELYHSIINLENELSGHNFDPSLRCSTHIHLDVRLMTVVQFKKLLLAYIMYEPLFFALSGDYRKTSNFCPCFAFAQNKLKQLANIWSDDSRDFLYQMSECSERRTNDKYSSLNLVPVVHQGSIEFRGSEPKPSAGQMIRLANRMLGLYDLVMESDESLNYVEFVEFLKSMELPEQLDNTLPMTSDVDVETLVEEGYVLAMDVLVD